MISNKYRSEAHGFTLVELIVSVALSAIVITSMVSTFVAFASGSKSVFAYADMSQQSRKALEQYSRDIRAAEDVTVAEEQRLVIVYPNDSFYSGQSVEYTYDPAFEIFSRIEREQGGGLVSNSIQLDGVKNFVFHYFDPLGQSLAYNTQSLLLSIKSVQIDAKMERAISRVDVSDYIISARFMMRNRTVTK
jgi:prepilin-type N-terminal cleavage/methylation domain-containing protein